jgi:hypothetical protein
MSSPLRVLVVMVLLIATAPITVPTLLMVSLKPESPGATVLFVVFLAVVVLARMGNGGGGNGNIWWNVGRPKDKGEK